MSSLMPPPPPPPPGDEGETHIWAERSDRLRMRRREGVFAAAGSFFALLSLHLLIACFRTSFPPFGGWSLVA